MDEMMARYLRNMAAVSEGFCPRGHELGTLGLCALCPEGEAGWWHICHRGEVRPWLRWTRLGSAAAGPCYYCGKEGVQFS